MGRIVQKVTKTTTTTTKRVKKVPEGYHKCSNCGGDGVCKNQTRRKKS